MRPVCLIVHLGAGGGRAGRRLRAVRAALDALGATVRVCPTRDLGHAGALARDATARGETATAMGGDGLVGAVGSRLVGTDGVLAILPAGRGNDFARALGVPRDPVAACAVLAIGCERAVDVGDADGRPFLGVASVGLDSRVQAIAAATRLELGRLVYPYGVLRALARWEPVEWTVALDGVPLRFRGLSVAIANSGVYGGGMRIAPDAALDDGQLDVVMIGAVTRRRVLATLPRVFSGGHVHEASVRVRRARTVEVHADRPQVAWADGEPLGPLPLRAAVRPGALRVLTPHPAPHPPFECVAA